MRRFHMNHQFDWSHSSKGDPLWLSDTDEGYIEALLVSVQGDKIIVEDKGGKVRPSDDMKMDFNVPTRTRPYLKFGEVR